MEREGTEGMGGVTVTSPGGRCCEGSVSRRRRCPTARLTRTVPLTSAVSTGSVEKMPTSRRFIIIVKRTVTAR